VSEQETCEKSCRSGRTAGRDRGFYGDAVASKNL
jgi:hypothetical protein